MGGSSVGGRERDLSGEENVPTGGSEPGDTAFGELYEPVEEVASSRMISMDRLARRRDPRMVAPFGGFDNAARRFVGAIRGVATSSTAS